METIVKFKVIKENGRKASIKVKYTDCPEFQEITKVANFANHKTKDGFLEVKFGENIEGDFHKANITTSIEDQIDEWVESFDKLSWMHDNEVMIILNWEVISYTGMIVNKETGETGLSIIKTKEPEQKLSNIEMMKAWFVMNRNTISEKFVNDYIAVYHTLEPNMKGIKWDKQMEITFGAMGIAAQGAITALDNLSAYSKALDQVDWKKHYKNKGHGQFEYDMDAIRAEAKRIQFGENVEDRKLIK